MKVVATATAAGRSKFGSTSLTRAVREGIRGMGAAADNVKDVGEAGEAVGDGRGG